MNPLSGPRQQQQKQQQKQKTLRIKKQGNTLEFHSRLIEAAEGTRPSAKRRRDLPAPFQPNPSFSGTLYQSVEVEMVGSLTRPTRPGGPPAKRQPSPEGLGKPHTSLDPC